MTLRAKVLILSMSFLCLVIAVGTAYLIGHKILSLKFRATNDVLHKQQAPITLDFLIPAGTYVDEQMTIGEVVKVRLQKPRRKLDDLLLKLSEIIPPKYLLLGTLLLYLFWTFLFLVFLRVFTWIGYGLALSISFFAGSLVYFFMPDLMFGKIDDVILLGWAVAFAVACRWYSKRRKLKHAYS